MIKGVDGTQPGDPARAAAAIRTALAADRPPLRLPLGEDALDGILAHLTAVGAQARTWAEVSRSTAYPAA